MTRPLLKMLTTLLVLVLAAASALANNWNGDWQSNFGQLRLLQNGDRLHGDYADRGVIEGKIGPDGRTARAFFVWNDGRWGTVEWRLANDRISGKWAWSQDGLPEPKGNNTWSATRSSTRTSPLKFSLQGRPTFPRDNAINKEPYRSWRSFARTRPSPQPAPGPRVGLSRWYGGYSVVNINPAFDISVDVIHYEGVRTAAVDMSISANPQGGCPDVMHTELCRELRDRADARGYVRVDVTGVRLINLGDILETLQVMFRLPGDRRDRLLQIVADATYYSASIVHPRRGYDLAHYAQGRSHLCEQTACSNDVFRDLRNNPQRYRGSATAAKIDRMIALPNRIAESHRRAQPRPQPQTQPGPSPRPLLSDVWAILEETSENIGEIGFSPDGGRLAASGKLRGFFETRRDHDTVFTFAAQTDQAVAFDLVTYAGGSGESKAGRLIVELPSFASNNPRGTLIVGEEVLLVELVRPTPGLNPDEVEDVPAVGIYSVNYSLRDVPPGRKLRLRKEPRRNGAVVGSIPANTSGLQMLACDDDRYQIRSSTFEQADQAGKMNMLSRTWCQISTGQIAGWIPGRYLRPNRN